MRLIPTGWISTFLPGRGSAAPSSPPDNGPAQPARANDETPLGGLRRLRDSATHNPLTRVARVSTTTTSLLESARTSSGTLHNPVGGSAEFPRPPQRKGRPEPATLARGESRIGRQGGDLADASIGRGAAFVGSNGRARGGVPVPRFMSPRAIGELLGRQRRRTEHIHARAWADALDHHFQQPAIMVNQLFPIAHDADPQAAHSQQAAIDDLLAGLIRPRQRPLLARPESPASPQMPGLVERLPPECAMPVATALARASHGDPALASAILTRLQTPLDIAQPAAGDASAADPVEAGAWQCAQALAHTRGAGLLALLHLQYGRASRDMETGNTDAARLVVYLQAAHKLRSIDANAGVTPAELNDDTVIARNLDEPRARQAALALRVARALPAGATDVHDTGECSPEEITAYRTWQMGFDESGPGSELQNAAELMYKAGTTWVERGAERQMLKDRAMGPLDGAPPAQRFAHARSRLRLAAYDTPGVFGADRSPISTSSLLAADVPFYDTHRGLYDTALIGVRADLLDYSRAALQQATTPGAILNNALNVQRLGAWADARPTVPTDATLRQVQTRRPESFAINRREARGMWSAARADVETLHRAAEQRGDRNAARTLRHALNLFDDPGRRDRFVHDMVDGARGDAAKNGFTLTSLERWMDESGVARHEPDRATAMREQIDAARTLTTQPGVPALEQITPGNLRDQQLAMMENNILGTGYTSYVGNAIGVDTSAWANARAKILLSAGPIVSAIGGRDSMYSIGTTYDGGQMMFGERTRFNAAAGVQGFVGLSGSLLGREGMAGVFASSTVGGAASKENSIVLRARRLADSRANGKPDDDLWRDDSAQMINAYWAAAHSASSPEELMQIFAELTADNPRISLASQKNNASTVAIAPLTVGAAIRANVADSGGPTRVGVYASAGPTLTVSGASRVDTAGDLRNVVNATVAQASMVSAVGAQFASRAVTAGDGTGEIGSVSPAAKTLASTTVEQARVGRSSFVYLTQDARGFVPEFMIQDRMFRNPDDWAHAMRSNPAWRHGIGSERLEQVIDQALHESSGEFAFGERWIIKEDRVPKLNQYLAMSNQLNARLDEDKSRRTLTRQQRNETKARLGELERKMREEFEDPAAWKPLGLFGLRETSRSSSQGFKYGARMSREETTASGHLTFWAPASEPDVDPHALAQFAGSAGDVPAAEAVSIGGAAPGTGVG